MLGEGTLLVDQNVFEHDRAFLFQEALGLQVEAI